MEEHVMNVLHASACKEMIVSMVEMLWCMRASLITNEHTLFASLVHSTPFFNVAFIHFLLVVLVLVVLVLVVIALFQQYNVKPRVALVCREILPDRPFYWQIRHL